MGLTNIRKIASELITAGLPAKTPAAAINMGTRPEQRTITTTLDTLAYTIERAKLEGATLVVVGQVVTCPRRWHGSLPHKRPRSKPGRNSHGRLRSIRDLMPCLGPHMWLIVGFKSIPVERHWRLRR